MARPVGILRDPRFLVAVEDAVVDIEHTTDAEIVVVAAGRSGSYRDIALLGGIAVGLLVLLFVVYAPWAFSPLLLPLELALAIGAVAVALDHAPRALSRLVPRVRRARQVRAAAAVAFTDEEVHATKRRTGVLVYVSALENAVHVIADHGVMSRVPRAATALDGGTVHDLNEFLIYLKELGGFLAQYVPPHDGDNPDEIPNTPRIRP